MKIHKLKTWPDYFEAVLNGEKTFEIRENDRGFQKGDIVVLEEYDPTKSLKIEAMGRPIEDVGYTGRKIEKQISYVTNWEQKENYIVMSIRNTK